MQTEYSLKKGKSVFVLLVLIVLAGWGFLSVLRTGYNFFRLATEERSLFSKSSVEKKQEFYADAHTISHFILENLKEEDSVIIDSADGGLYFRLRYLLYPRKVYWVGNVTLYKIKPRWTYILHVDKNSQVPHGGKLIRDDKTGRVIGELIKK